MNLLVRSLSPSGQGSSSGSTGSPGGNRSSRGNANSPSKSFFRQRSGTTGSKPRLGHSRSYAGDRDKQYHPSVQPHILFDLDSDPLPFSTHRSDLIASSSVPSPTSVSTVSTVTASSKPSWLRLRKPLSSGKFSSDRYSSPPTPSDFDYYEYFSNYARSPSDPGDVVTRTQSNFICSQSSPDPRDVPVPPIRLNRLASNRTSGAHLSSDHETKRRTLFTRDDNSLEHQYTSCSSGHFFPLRRSDLLTQSTRSSGMVADTLTSAGGGAVEQETGAAASTGDLFSRSKTHLKVDASTTGASVHYPPVTPYYYSVPPQPPSSHLSSNQYFGEASAFPHHHHHHQQQQQQQQQHELMLHPSIHSIDHHNQYSSLSATDYIDQSSFPSDALSNHRVLHLSDTPPVSRHHLFAPSHLTGASNQVQRSRPSSVSSYYPSMDPTIDGQVSFDYPSVRCLQQRDLLHQQQQQQGHLMRHRDASTYQVNAGYLSDSVDYPVTHSSSFRQSAGHTVSSVLDYSQTTRQPCVSKYTHTSITGNNGNTRCQCFRISFIETSAYIAQDIPGTCTSPEHLPPNHRFNKHVHSEWMTESIHELRKIFKPPSASILVNVEKKSKYPFIILGKLPSDFDTRSFVPTAISNVLSPDLRINDGLYDVIASLIRPITPLAMVSSDIQLKHFTCTSQHSQLDCMFDVNEEDAAFKSQQTLHHSQQQHLNCDLNDSMADQSHETSRSPVQQNRTSPPLGYVVLAFQTFPGEDSSKLEENWITWTGAQILYKYLPIASGLRRIVFFKRHDLHLLKSRHSPEASPLTSCTSSSSSGQQCRVNVHTDESTFKLNSSNFDSCSFETDPESPIISYVLLCECTQLTETILTSVCAVIDQLRARCCGYSALYVDST